MPGQRLPMRKIRDVLRLSAAGMSSRKIAASLVVGATTVVDCLQRARQAGISWPLLDDLSDEALEARLFPASTALAEIEVRRPRPHWPTIHRELRRAGRDAAAALGGASRRAPRRLWLQPLLRAVSGLGRPAVADDAADPRRRRAAVRRLRRHDDGGDRRGDRRGADSAAVRRCPRRVELYLCRGYLDAGPCRLDRLAHARFCFFRRRAGDGGVRQSEVRRHQGVLLRAGGEPQLRRDGSALRHGRGAGAALQAARQGQGRGRRAGGDALDHRQAAQPPLLLVRRAQ